MKFIILLFFSIILVSHAKVIILADLIKAYQFNNEIDSGAVVANQAVYIPMTLKNCDNSSCNSICRALGYNHGSCISSNTCHCYN